MYFLGRPSRRGTGPMGLEQVDCEDRYEVGKIVEETGWEGRRVGIKEFYFESVKFQTPFRHSRGDKK